MTNPTPRLESQVMFTGRGYRRVPASNRTRQRDPVNDPWTLKRPLGEAVRSLGVPWEIAGDVQDPFYK